MGAPWRPYREGRIITGLDRGRGMQRLEALGHLGELCRKPVALLAFEARPVSEPKT
jgi:hypothetical protein